jgi:5-methylcytosine-specific restriction enzyme A
MPHAALRPCPGSPTCPARVRPGTRCPDHQRAHNAAHGWGKTEDHTATRLRGRALQVARQRLFADEPFCRECAAAGKRTLADIRDHIIPLAEGGLEVPENTQPLCKDCSDRKTQQESRRGLQRNRW